MGWQDAPVAPASDPTSTAAPPAAAWMSAPVAPDAPASSGAPSTDSMVASAPYDATDAALHGMTLGLSDMGRAAMMAGGRYMRGDTPGFDYSQAATELKRGREAYANESPIGSAAANLAGGLTMAPATMASAGRTAGPLMQAVRGAMTGAGMGAVQGAADNSTSLADASNGALNGAEIGGVIGGAIPASRSLMPGLTPQAQALRALGVEPTPGSAMGGFPGAAENLLGRVPVLGAPIQAGRRAAQEQFTQAVDQQAQNFQRSTINQPLSHIGESLTPGTELGNPAIDEMATRIGQAYDRAVPAAGATLDNTTFNSLMNARANLALRAPTRVQQFDDFVSAKVLNPLDPNGVLPGQAFKDAESDFGGEVRRLMSGNSSSDERALGTAYRDAQGALRDGLQRNAPASAADIGAANQAYRESLPVMDAAGRNLNGNFTPIQLGASAARAGGRRSYARGTAPMQSVAQAGEQDRQDLTQLGTTLRPPAGAGGHGGGLGLTGGFLMADLVERMLEHPHGAGLAAAALGYPMLSGLYSNAGRGLVNSAASGAGGLLSTIAPLSPLLGTYGASEGGQNLLPNFAR